MKALYTAHAVSTGDGRNGHVSGGDGLLDFDVRMPPELGGPGGALNPELLFAAGYAACFHSALQSIARAEKVDLGASEVEASVGLGKEGEGFGLSAILEVSIPGAPREVAESLVAKAHEHCPYSRATRGNIEVEIDLVQAAGE
ncbi:organic hydroperoxide resistance protein [Glycomyces sp. TRM65418]|uniref:organic hydroperoxide resistance protein n=1 Tax=Glycomyces sp. TRM65418 TaxID=2867006 RepID=UPI001CE57368|nr:organic hydroperoxide resistance protein [Glycomyces sp. TRM65418]MCC3762967.1 organic hydroperoxide resistance protein [Glycomyces sp. TRM65418]QZD56987.1 organic hydroperoxide resistance protein [Glycomyces sp. TRM65418]